MQVHFAQASWPLDALKGFGMTIELHTKVGGIDVSVITYPAAQVSNGRPHIDYMDVLSFLGTYSTVSIAFAQYVWIV